MANQGTGRGGTDESGYSVSFDAAARTIRLDAWGFWSLEVCSTFAKALLDTCRRSAGVRRLEIETTRLKPLREEGESAWAMALGALPSAGIEVIVVKTNSLTKLQLLRIARHSASKDLVQFV
jgi:hypothetical protein